MASNRIEASAPKALTDDDESRLESAMRNALGLDIVTDTPVYPVRLEEGTRRDLLRTEIERLSARDRRTLWTLRVRSGKDDLGAIEEYFLNRTKREIRRSLTVLRDFDGTSLPPESAELFGDLYDTAAGIGPHLQRVWENESVFIHAVFRSTVRSTPPLREELSHFLPQQEMQEIYLRHRSRQYLQQLLVKRIDAYVAGLDSSHFDRIEEALLPLYYLRPLTHFPFDRLLQRYGIEGSPRGKKGATRFGLSDGIEYLERLYHAIYVARRLPEDTTATGDLLQAFGFSPDEAERLAASMSRLADTAREFSRKIPLADIIRVGRNDPFHRLQVYLPKVKLAEFYRARLTLTCLRTFDERFSEVREGVIASLLRRLFDEKLEPLAYYEAPDAADENGEKETDISLPRPKYGLAMRCLITFRHGHYRSVLQEKTRIIGRILPGHMREDQETLTDQARAFEDVVDRLIATDYGMAPQEYDGQTLTRLRRNIEHDISQQKAYQVVIAQKQREVLLLVNKALEHLKSMREVLESVNANTLDPAAQLEESYRSIRRNKQGNERLQESLQREIRVMDQLEALVTETLTIDDER